MATTTSLAAASSARSMTTTTSATTATSFHRNDGFSEEDILQQFKIHAIYQAQELVRERTGCDVRTKHDEDGEHHHRKLPTNSTNGIGGQNQQQQQKQKQKQQYDNLDRRTFHLHHRTDSTLIQRDNLLPEPRPQFRLPRMPDPTDTNRFFGDHNTNRLIQPRCSAPVLPGPKLDTRFIEPKVTYALEVVGQERILPECKTTNNNNNNNNHGGNNNHNHRNNNDRNGSDDETHHTMIMYRTEPYGGELQIAAKFETTIQPKAQLKSDDGS